MIWFLGDVQQGRDPLIQGGVDDPFGCAYTSLCSDVQEMVSEAEFRETQGKAVSDLLTADTYAGPSVYADRGLDEEYPDADPPPDVATAWTEVEAKWFEHLDERTVSAEPLRVETWRVDLVREDGEWRVCRFSRQPD